MIDVVRYQEASRYGRDPQTDLTEMEQEQICDSFKKVGLPFPCPDRSMC